MDCTGEFNYYRNEKLIGKSKIYVDFRNHPGKDRIPRSCN
jgi:hypothetical protein